MSILSWRPLILVPFAALFSGCASSMTPYKIAYKVVGKVVNEAEVVELEQKLMGQPSAAARSELGQPIDTWRDARSARRWIVFPAPLDVLDKHRMIVATENDRITALWKVERGGANELDIPRRLMLTEKVKGKSPREAERELEMGAPLLTVKSETTGRLAQMYDARLVDLGKVYYCILRYDVVPRCEELDFVTMQSGTASRMD